MANKNTPKELEELSQEELVLLVAQVRGCRPETSKYGFLYCPCKGSPHGFPQQTTRGGLVVPARIHAFPRDIAIGYLMSKGLEKQEVPKEGVTLCSVMMDHRGSLSIFMGIPVDQHNLEMLLALRGALKTMDDDFRDAIRSFWNHKCPGEDLDDMLDGGEPEGVL